ncbi:MAG: FtsX-like permease family protein [Phycisphaera sp.]|nr:FtsX-like permease family protein [Phycisphaera sp.]
MVILRLAIANLKRTKMRAALTIGAVAAAVSLVVVITSAFASLQQVAYSLLDEYYSAVDVAVAPTNNADVIHMDLVRAMEKDDRVNEVRVSLEVSSLMVDNKGNRLAPWPVKLRGLRDPAQHDAGRRALASGHWFEMPADANSVVIGEGVAAGMKLKVGDMVGLPRLEGGPVMFKVIGIVGKPDVLWIELPSVYMPLKELQDWSGYGDTASLLEIDLKPEVDFEAFVKDWETRTDLAGVPLKFKTELRHKGAFDQAIVGVRILSYLGGAIAMLAAAFIIFSTLAMGVAERSRLLGMLRAIGAVKVQVGQLVVIEGMTLSMVGAGLGVALGWYWTWLLAHHYPDLFIAGAVLSWGGVIFSVSGSLVAALAASLIPAVSATGVSALEAMTVVARPSRAKTIAVCAISGLLLMSIDHIIVFLPHMEQEVRLWTHLCLGLPTLMFGMFLLTPAIVLAVEPLLAPIIARLLFIQPALLRQQLSGGLWRTAGTVSALTVGLAALVVIQVHGRSLLGGWKLPTEFPDLVLFSPLGVDPKAMDAVESVPGVKRDSVLPIALVSPQLGTNVITLFGMMQRPNATSMFGVDVDKALGADDPPRDPMVGLEFKQGDLVTARRRLKEERSVIITEEFYKLKGIGVGDKIKINTTLNGEVEYTVVGVIRSIGADMIARTFNLEAEMENWTIGSMLTSLENVRRDFGITKLHLFMVNLDTADDKGAITKRVREAVGEKFGLLAADARRLKHGIDEGLTRLIHMLSTVALAAIAVASLGVINTIMASVRSRQWQLGVLRSIGLTRGSMLRIVLSEAILIGLIASAKGIAVGMILSNIGNRMSEVVAGYDPPWVIPVTPLIVGVSITLAVTLFASIIPAVQVSRADTLNLLKAGRSSA